MFEHPNAITTRPTIHTDFRTMERIYVIETDLVLSPEAQGYDQRKADEFMKAVQSYHEAHPSYDLIKIICKDSA